MLPESVNDNGYIVPNGKGGGCASFACDDAQASAAGKGIIIDLRHTVGDDNPSERSAVRKGVAANRGTSVGDYDGFGRDAAEGFRVDALQPGGQDQDSAGLR